MAVLRPATLPHFAALAVSPRLLEGRFARGCRTDRCDATCCQSGVLVDVRERDRVLAHVALVQAVMDPDQERDPGRWFEAKERPDPDFPSGRAVGTRVADGHCVFLDRGRRCVLQRATLAAGRGDLDLKPFFCTAFPVTIVESTLTIDDADFTDRPSCCSTVPDGELTVFDVCGRELADVLGPDGVRALRALADGRSGAGA